MLKKWTEIKEFVDLSVLDEDGDYLLLRNIVFKTQRNKTLNFLFCTEKKIKSIPTADTFCVMIFKIRK